MANSAELTGGTQLLAANTDAVDTTAKHPLGTIARDTSGNEYIYLQGVASTAADDAVTFDEAFATTRLVANAIGPVAVAQAAIVASSYGWYCIKGTCDVNADTVADNASLYIDTTAGQVDDAGVAGDWIQGMWSRSATASGVITAQLLYPGVYNNAYLT